MNHCALNCMIAHCMLLLSETNFSGIKKIYIHFFIKWQNCESLNAFEFMKLTFACMVFTVSDTLFGHKYRVISVTGLMSLLVRCRPALSMPMLKSWLPFIVQSGMKHCTCRTVCLVCLFVITSYNLSLH